MVTFFATAKSNKRIDRNEDLPYFFSLYFSILSLGKENVWNATAKSNKRIDRNYVLLSSFTLYDSILSQGNESVLNATPVKVNPT